MILTRSAPGSNPMGPRSRHGPGKTCACCQRREEAGAGRAGAGSRRRAVSEPASRCAGGDPLREHLGQPLRLGQVREVPRLREDLEPAAGDGAGDAAAVLDRDDGVLRAPDDQQRQVDREVEPVTAVDALALDVEDAACGVHEGLAGGGITQGAEPDEALPQARGQGDPGLAEQPVQAAAGSADPGAGDERQDELGAGQRRRPQERAHLGTESARADQGETPHPLGELVAELHRDPAAEAVPHHGDAVVAEGGEQVTDAARVRSEGVVPPRLGGLAVAEQVWGEHVVGLAEHRHDLRPLRGAGGHAVHEDDRRAAGGRAGFGVPHQVAVDRELAVRHVCH